MHEAGGLFTTQGWPQKPSATDVTATNKDLYLHQYGVGGGGGAATPTRGAAPAMPAMPGGQIPSGQMPRRMKKMPKK